MKVVSAGGAGYDDMRRDVLLFIERPDMILPKVELIFTVARKSLSLFRKERFPLYGVLSRTCTYLASSSLL